MSRSGYSDDVDQWQLIMYRGRVASATRGRRGQAMLRDLLAALDVMPHKRLIASEFQSGDNVCALGALAKSRCVDNKYLDAAIENGNNDLVAKQFDVATCLVNEVMFENDQDFMAYHSQETPEQRWSRMRAWVASQIRGES
jgi:hypothetical protein